MLKNKALRALLSACVFLLFASMTLLAQGVSGQDYAGLDKYLSQGIPENHSFVGVRAAEFLTIPVGARGIAMGSAYSSITDDITSIWWNPAGLGFLQQKEVMMTMVDYTLGLTYSYAAAAFPIADGNLVVGGFFGYLDVPDMEITTVTNPGGTGRFYTAYDLQAGGSMAYNLSDRFSAGLNVKFVHQDVWSNIGGSAFAIDAGGIYHTEFMDREIRFAFSIQNLGTNLTMSGASLLREVGPEGSNAIVPSGYGDYSDDPSAISRRNTRQMYYRTHTYRLPTVMKISLSYNLLTTEKANWLVAGEFWRPSNIPLTYALGTEVTFNFNPVYSAALRGGWKIQTDEYTEDKDAYGYNYLGDDPTFRGVSFGGGVKRLIGGKSLEFSYAYRNKGRLTADNYFTIVFGF
jgi:hypothetical protein